MGGEVVKAAEKRNIALALFPCHFVVGVRPLRLGLSTATPLLLLNVFSASKMCVYTLTNASLPFPVIVPGLCRLSRCGTKFPEFQRETTAFWPTRVLSFGL